jgi:tRNA-2-methylthio-N6-dimethylallyladenosine synthase
MRRGYTREAYLSLLEDARRIIPGVAISTDMISGFCGETEEEHRQSVELMKEAAFDQVTQRLFGVGMIGCSQN